MSKKSFSEEQIAFTLRRADAGNDLWRDLPKGGRGGGYVLSMEEGLRRVLSDECEPVPTWTVALSLSLGLRKLGWWVRGRNWRRALTARPASMSSGDHSRCHGGESIRRRLFASCGVRRGIRSIGWSTVRSDPPRVAMPSPKSSACGCKRFVLMSPGRPGGTCSFWSWAHYSRRASAPSAPACA